MKQASRSQRIAETLGASRIVPVGRKRRDPLQAWIELTETIGERLT